MSFLNVNIDHVATLRQARKAKIPDILKAAELAEKAGADGITVHLRHDRRHIQESDVRALKKNVKTKLNLEMSTHPEIVAIALDVKPQWATLVPESPGEVTTQGGLDISGNRKRIAEVTATLKKSGIKVSHFINPEPGTVKLSAELKADFVELHTGIYAVKTGPAQKKELDKLAEAALLAKQSGLSVNAGHDLDYRNVRAVALIKEIDEFSIGFSIIARAVLAGLETAVREMMDLLK